MGVYRYSGGYHGMMRTQMCVQCYSYHEYYHVRTIPDCPRCGARGMYEPPMTRDQYLRSMGCWKPEYGEVAA